MTIPDANALVEAHLDLAEKTARWLSRRWPSWIDREEIVCAAYAGLVEAARRYDPERCPSFETYARKSIAWAIGDWVRSEDRLSRSHRERLQARGEEPPQTHSLDPDQCPLAWREWHPRDLQADYAEEIIAQLFRVLPKRSRLVMRLRYLEYREWSEVGQQLGMTATHACYLGQRAMARLREWAQQAEVA